MTRFPVHFVLLLTLVFGTIYSSASTTLFLEDKLKELESRLEMKINLLEAKNVQLEDMVTQLKTQLEKKNDDREEWISIVTDLKYKIQQQETVLSALLLNEKKEPSGDFNHSSNTHQSHQVTINGLPSSCEDLKSIGHTLNGFYSVMGNATMESVYCDFTKLPSDAGFQKRIGYTDVKSVPVHFYVQRSSNFITQGTPIPFDSVRLNEGNAMNLTSGIFTVPRPGIYFFSFVGLAQFPDISSHVWFGVGLYLNGILIGSGWVEESNNVANKNRPLLIHSTLKLKNDDQVSVQIDYMSYGAYLFDDRDHQTHFTGFMLEEESVAAHIEIWKF